MAASEADICNIALARIGQRQLIQSLDDATESAEIAKAFYADGRDAVLASVAWPFATRHAVLALLNFTRTGWAYAYATPADLLVPLRLYPAGTSSALAAAQRNPPAEARIPYAIEDNFTAGPAGFPLSSGRLLLTDQQNAELVYTAQFTTVKAMPPLFIDALAWRLASDFALAIPVKPQVAAMMQQQYERALSRAAARAFQGTQDDPPNDAEYIRARS